MKKIFGVLIMLMCIINICIAQSNKNTTPPNTSIPHPPQAIPAKPVVNMVRPELQKIDVVKPAPQMNQANNLPQPVKNTPAAALQNLPPKPELVKPTVPEPKAGTNNISK